MAKETVSDPKRPVLDEQTLDKLLEAAFVIQEQGGDLQKAARNHAASSLPAGNQPAANQPSTTQLRAAANSKSPTAAGPPRAVTEKETTAAQKIAAEKSSAAAEVSAGSASLSKDNYTLTLAQIVETQQQILTRRLDFESAMALVAQRAAEITRASGSAIGIIEDKPDTKKLQYRAVSGLLGPARGSEVAMEKALSFNCLRSGEVIRGAEVNSDFLLDGEECRRRGIGSLIAVPIYRDSGIAGAVELYFASANAFTEQDVHSCQLMAGLVTEALGRDAGLWSRKSLVAERNTMLQALEKLRPNLAALMESPALKESLAKSAASAAAPPASKAAQAAAPAPPAPLAAVPLVAPAGVDVSTAGVPSAGVSLSGVSFSNSAASSIPKKPAAAGFLCRKCGNELVGEEMFCGKCGSPRSSEYQPPTMQSKLASLWQMQQAGKQGAAPAPANGSVRPPERKISSGFPAEIQPWEAVLSELEDPFGEPEPEATRELEAEAKPAHRSEPAAPLQQEVTEISAAARKFSSSLDAPDVDAHDLHAPVHDAPELHTRVQDESIGEESFKKQTIEQESGEADLEADLPVDADLDVDWNVDEETEKNPAALAGPTALAFTRPLPWSSAAKAKAAFEQLAASRNQNSFVRFWNARRGDVYLAVAVVLVAAVIRWSIWSPHSLGANGGAAKISHRRPAPDADLSAFDKLLISLGLAEPPDPVEDKGNPDTQVWVDLHSALYYCPGADLYGKTPQGKYTNQRDAQLGQFEPAYRKPCN
ncbi:MAG: GAF domain-containing protein [Candidatus Sulfotelmatobacter sp.]